MNNDLIYYIAVFVFGLIVGSFLNVVILRLDSIESIIKGRSHCPKCKKILGWKDLIPFLSFVLLRGKCRYCNNSISWQYPAVEISTACVFVVLLHLFGFSWSLIFYAVIFSLLIVVFVYDLLHEMIPEEIVWIALIISLLGSWYFGGFGVANMLLGGLIAGSIPAILVIISKEKWMGAGDIKLGFLLGAMVGYPEALFLLFSSFVLGSIVGIILMGIKKKEIKDSVPFAPFLVLSGLITIIWGNYFISWYLGYLNI